jgi:predicted metalloprotease with PDZ domain
VKRTPIALALSLSAISCEDSGIRSERIASEEAATQGAVPTRQIEARLPGVAANPDFRLRVDPAMNAVDVRIEVRAEEPTSIHLIFRVEWDGYPGLPDRLQKVEAWGPGGALAVETGDLDAGHRVVEVETPQTVTIDYRLVLNPGADTRYYHRVSQLSEDGGHLLGNDLLPRVWIGQPRNVRQSARIWFSGMPNTWRVATIESRSGTGYEIDEIGAAVFVIGRLHTQREGVGPRTMDTAVYGDWPVPAERVIDASNRIAGSLHLIAGDGWAGGAYLLGAGRVPAAVPGLSTGGQVIGHSGIVLVGGNGPPALEFAHWMHTTAHELMHWYIPMAFRFEGAPPKWFSEGFTDYMALRILLSGGLIEPQLFLSEIGDRLSRYRGSSLYGRTSITDAEEDFWKDDVYRYIYDGGAAAAFLLDLGFQDRGGSLERALREARANAPLTPESLASLLSGIRENEWLTAWLETGANPDWDARLQAYDLVWRNDSLVSTDDWATDALGSIRP